MPGMSQPQTTAPISREEDSREASDSDGLARGSKLAVFLFLGGLYICTSSGLIAFNKFLMHPERFPYAVALVLMHATFCSVLTGILFLVFPSLFPSLRCEDKSKRVSVDWNLFLKGTLPVSLLFTAQLVLSNTAYLHASVAFIQMMKEANLVLVYTLSLLVALEKFKWMHLYVLLFVLAATALTIHGEMNFSMTGFVIQGLGQIFECLRIVLQALLLTAAGRKLDALSYVLLVMPLCFFFLGGSLFVIHFWPNDHFHIPTMTDISAWWPYLLLNSLVAFALNVVVALFIKHSEAVSFILAGILKDAMIVCIGAFVLREMISVLQIVGFSMQIVGILIWSAMKLYPEAFERGIGSGLYEAVLGGGGGAKKPATATPPRDYGSARNRAA